MDKRKFPLKIGFCAKQIHFNVHFSILILLPSNLLTLNFNNTSRIFNKDFIKILFNLINNILFAVDKNHSHSLLFQMWQGFYDISAQALSKANHEFSDLISTSYRRS